MGHDIRRGYAATLGAFIIWGLAPLFWALLRHIDPQEQLAHRIVWSAALAAGALGLGGWVRAFGALRSPRLALALLTTTVLVAINWFTFIWAVTHDRVTETSLGYYANPLLNVVLGRLVLGEVLSLRKAWAVLLAFFGVAYLTWSFGRFPWVSAVLALSFGTYGLIRKVAPISALSGLAIETGLWAPLAFIFLMTLDPPFGSMVSGTHLDALLLVLAGAMTALPLLLFGVGARILDYSTVGMLQYLAPSLQLVCAVFVFGEPFTPNHAVAFFFIWLAVAVYASDLLG